MVSNLAVVDLVTQLSGRVEGGGWWDAAGGGGMEREEGREGHEELAPARPPRLVPAISKQGGQQRGLIVKRGHYIWC